MVKNINKTEKSYQLGKSIVLNSDKNPKYGKSKL